MIKLKRVYDPREPDDGDWILVTTLWPRGVRKNQVDRWIKELGVPKDLLRKWLAEKISPREFEQQYRASLKTPEKQKLLAELAERARKGNITLVTSVRDLSRSHIQLLKKVVKEKLAKSA